MQSEGVFFREGDDPEKIKGWTVEALYQRTLDNPEHGCMGLLKAVYDLLSYGMLEKATELMALGKSNNGYFQLMSWYAMALVEFALTDMNRPAKEVRQFLDFLDKQEVGLTVFLLP